MKTLAENFMDWEGHAIGFGYGTGEPHTVPAVRRFLELCNDTGAYDYERLEADLGATVAWLLISILAKEPAIIEYGSSPRYAWLTPEGKELRKFMLSMSADELVDLLGRKTEDYIPCYPDACNCGPNGYEKGRGCQNPFWRTKP